MKIIVESFRLNSTLTSINLTGNLITNDEMKCLIEALHTNSTLTSCIIKNCKTVNESLRCRLYILCQINKINSSNLWVHWHNNIIESSSHVYQLQLITVFYCFWNLIDVINLNVDLVHLASKYYLLFHEK
eukprot:TRINITY_DN3483_c0_g1_i1.p2 TRINITY_DN3483_c0_g1~~TRINITY_DN3483_c0_g1_i1.p2  ORF type:complete len:130 (+),score=6.72 TRINITY_DN3483_c0_g1_i1:277-666(+)